MGPRRSRWSSSPVERNSIIAGKLERPSPAQIRDKRPHILILEVKETFPTRKLLGGQKGSNANLPIGLFAGIHLG